MAIDFTRLLPQSAVIDRSAGSLDGRMDWKQVPAKAAVYLLSGCEEAGASAEEVPLVLATVGDLRAALKRRLDDAEQAGEPPTETAVEAASPQLTRRIPYHRLCTRVQFRIVHSPFAANLHYLQAVRLLHPSTYRELLSFGSAWWATVNPGDAFPRLRPTQAIADPRALYAGPIRDRSAAARLIDSTEDLFDLCREYPTLQLAPHGRACAYKEMGKCPAPCDGSVEMSWYHSQMATAWDFVTDRAARAAWERSQEGQMRDAAARLEFERAARIKNRIARGGFLDGKTGDAYASLAPLGDFSWLALQPGRGKRLVEPFLIHGGVVTALAEIGKKEIAGAAPRLLEEVQRGSARPILPPLEEEAIDHVALLAHHLFRNDPGTYVRVREVVSGGVSRVEALLEGFFAARAKGLAAAGTVEAVSP